jgi:hypothetical protein
MGALRRTKLIPYTLGHMCTHMHMCFLLYIYGEETGAEYRSHVRHDQSEGRALRT